MKNTITTIAILFLLVGASRAQQNIPTEKQNSRKSINIDLEVRAEVRAEATNTTTIMKDHDFYLQQFVHYYDIYEEKFDRTNLDYQIDLPIREEQDLIIIETKEDNLQAKKRAEILEVNKIRDYAAKYYHKAKMEKTLYSPFANNKFKSTVTNNKFTFKSRLTELFFTNQLADKDLTILKGTTFSFNIEKSASVYTEVLSDYLYFGKFSLAAQLDAQQIEKDSSGRMNQEATINNLVSGGGNISLTYNVPILAYNSQQGLKMGLSCNPIKTHTKIPGLGQTIDDPTFFFAHGLESYFVLRLLKGEIGFYGQYQPSMYWGDQNFKDALPDLENDYFFVGQVTLGLSIKESFRIGLKWHHGNDFVKENFPQNVLSVTIIP